MPGFESIIDQKRPVGILTNLLHRGNVPHALLFTGLDGVGKRAAAVALAVATNCQAVDAPAVPPSPKLSPDVHEKPNSAETMVPGGCGECTACRKIKSGSHPDVHWVKPAGANIKISQIRLLAERVALKPYEANCRVIIIENAHRMNAAASNALLKLLEEPPDRTLFVLTAPQPGDLLPTVVSRCQHIRFNPIAPQKLQAILMEEHAVPEAEAAIIATLSSGSTKTAETMAQSNWLARRKWLICQVMDLSLEKVNRILALADFISNDRNRLQDYLLIMQTWSRDLLVQYYDPGKMLNADLATLIPQAQANWHPEAIIKKMKAIENVRKRIEANANPRLACEALLLQIVGEPEQITGSPR